MTKRIIPVLVLLLVVTALLLFFIIFIHFDSYTSVPVETQDFITRDLVIEELVYDESTDEGAVSSILKTRFNPPYQSVDQNKSGGDNTVLKPQECRTDSQCGNDFYSTPFCFSGNVYRYKTEFSCAAGSCDKDKKKEIVDHCLLGCSNSACIKGACSTNNDCNDNNPTTFDSCVNPGKINSFCKNEPMSCSKNSDCGSDGFIENKFCQSDDVYQKYKVFTCNNAGSLNSSCTSTIDQRLVTDCPQSCSSGACTNFACNIDNDCDDSNNYTRDSCVNPGSVSSFCKHDAIACYTNQDCNDTNPKTQDVCHEQGTVNAYCTHIFVSCNSNSECNDNNSYTKDNCVNAGTSYSYCNYENIRCITNTDCNDANNRTKDSCVNAATVDSFCKNEPISCFSNSECNDSNSKTQDSCVNAGEPGSFCKHEGIVCTTDNDCENEQAGNKFCVDTNVFQTFTKWSCINGGSIQSLCVAKNEDRKMLTCPSNNMCSAGNCISVTCSKNSDCGMNDLVGVAFCKNDDVYKNFKTYICTNPASSTSACNSDIETKLFSDCMNGCTNGQCNTGTLEICTNGIDDNADGKIDGLIELNPNNGETKKIGNARAWDTYAIVENVMRAHGQSSPRDLLGVGSDGGAAFVGGIGGVYSSLMGTKVCTIMGYQNYAAINGVDYTNRIIWSNGGDSVYNWNGANWERIDDLKPHNNPLQISWMADITCKNRLAACNDGWDNDNDGKTDSADDGCTSRNDDSEVMHDPMCSANNQNTNGNMLETKTYCAPEPRETDFCIQIYKPVCGWFDPNKIQCIRYPCAQTFSNSCVACSNNDVLYWTEGECPQ